MNECMHACIAISNMHACDCAELLAELRRREKELGVEADWAVNAMMKAGTIEGAEHSVSTEFIIKMLGLDICADTIVGNAMTRGVSGGQKKRVTSGAHTPDSFDHGPFARKGSIVRFFQIRYGSS